MPDSSDTPHEPGASTPAADPAVASAGSDSKASSNGKGADTNGGKDPGSSGDNGVATERIAADSGKASGESGSDGADGSSKSTDGGERQAGGGSSRSRKSRERRRKRGRRGGGENRSREPAAPPKPPWEGETPDPLDLNELKVSRVSDLQEHAQSLDIENIAGLSKQQLIFAILEAHTYRNGEVSGSGVVERLPDGYAFLRSPMYSYLAGPDDIYLSPSQVRRFSLRTGDTVEGRIRAPKEGERYFALLEVNSINFEPPEV
ncbi:MAG TPA: hypothetical protein DIU15_00690, partial [Deltaproteobacteria bacterium]|nr:hypothetical protein [Deltaproteobacteria bacterium]